MKDLDKKRINQYFKNPDSQDQDFVAELFSAHKDEEELSQIALNHWKDSSDEKINLQHILNSIHFNINSNTKQKSIGKKILSMYLRVAAVLLIPILISGVLFWNSSSNHVTYAQLKAPKGSRIQFTLPDGSTGNLNGGSTLTYATNFNSRRAVKLVGEGYFKVKKDSKRPFTVQTKYADIKVLGTEFDVSAYDREHEITTTLESGSVEVFNKETSTVAMLKPGQQNRLNILTGEMQTENVKTDLYTSWKDNLLRFDNAPFGEVIKKMERWYGVKIILDKSLQYSERYTMTIKTESLREMLQLLKLTTPINYKINNDMVFIEKPN